MEPLPALEERIRARIPLTRHLGFSLERHTPGELILHAPLEPNINDKGTFFAGSQAALLALAGWALTTLEADRVAAGADVVAVESSLKHQAPAPFDARLTATAGNEALDHFRQRLHDKGRGKLPLAVTLNAPDGEVVTTYEGLYMARSMEKTGA